MTKPLTVFLQLVGLVLIIASAGADHWATQALLALLGLGSAGAGTLGNWLRK